MPRVKLQINKDELVAAIEAVEENGPFANRSLLHEAVAATEWAQKHQPKPVTASVVGLRIEEYGIEPQTPKGRRGRSSGPRVTAVKTTDGSKRSPRSKAERLAQPGAVAIYDELARIAPASFQKTIERARNGSMAAAVRLNCARCVGFDNVAKNVHGCTTMDCPLWAYRPYQVTVRGRELEDSDIEHGVAEEAVA